MQSEYWEQITALTELAVELAKKDPEKLGELVNRLPDLPRSAHESLLGHLSSDAVADLSESERLPIWENLTDLVRHHRKFFDADWALPDETVTQIEATTNLLAPDAPELKYRHLFSDRDFDLFDEKGDYDEQRRRLDEARQTAVATILAGGNFGSVLAFSENVAAPYDVGRALGVIASDELECHILPSRLDAEGDTLWRVIAGFVWARYWERKDTWVDAVLGRDWNADQKAAFLKLLPFEEKIWQRVSTHLGEQDEAHYWRGAKVNPYGPDRDLTIAIEKLLEYGRAGAAVMCVARTADDKFLLDETLATRALLAVLDSPSAFKELDNYRTVELIKHLQKSSTIDQDALFRIEWNFLPWLGRFSSGSPITLEKRLASDPSFFAEAVAVGLVFRSKNSSEGGNEEPNEQKKSLARNAYKLLTQWTRCPGTQEDGAFDIDAFNTWINEARRITEETGHTEVAQLQIGHVLTRAPSDPNGLWIHEAVASTLNYRDTGEMRSGFTMALYNQRGVHGFTHGREERELAKQNREKAENLDRKGYTRFAAAMREFAEQYDRQAEREERRDPFEA